MERNKFFRASTTSSVFKSDKDESRTRIAAKSSLIWQDHDKDPHTHTLLEVGGKYVKWDDYL
ncbi:hypothetical protein RhiirA4_483922 [Rhizophagus irregularis]|uniref:Uncharacterized protein n=1 Tax=Rhizophagus irregularis TaxID=588596 RepID=A0A2I1HN81_9GLOM|nr:hypothetical protein RhiirA4_483922 [Rhizophagus irregularis]